MDKRPLVAQQPTTVVIEDFSHVIENVPNIPVLLHAFLMSQSIMEVQDEPENSSAALLRLVPSASELEPSLNVKETDKKAPSDEKSSEDDKKNDDKKDDNAIAPPQVTSVNTVNSIDVRKMSISTEDGGSPKTLSIAENKMEESVSNIVKQVENLIEQPVASTLPVSSEQDSIMAGPSDVAVEQTSVSSTQNDALEQNTDSETSKSNETSTSALSQPVVLPLATPTNQPDTIDEQTHSTKTNIETSAPLIKSPHIPPHLKAATITVLNSDQTQNTTTLNTTEYMDKTNAEKTDSDKTDSDKTDSDNTVVAEGTIIEKPSAKEAVVELTNIGPVSTTPTVETIASSSISLAPTSLTLTVPSLSSIQSDLTSLSSPLQAILSTSSVLSSLSSQAEAVVATLTSAVLSDPTHNSATPTSSTWSRGEAVPVISTPHTLAPSHVSVVKGAPQISLVQQLPRDLAMLASMSAEKLKVGQAEIFQSSSELFNQKKIEIKSQEDAGGKAPPQVAVIPPIIDLSKSQDQSRFIAKQQQHFKKGSVTMEKQHTPSFQASHRGKLFYYTV